MAVGDVVSGLSGNNSTLSFQPAAGVEVAITYWGTDTAVGRCSLWDGTHISQNNSGGTNFGKILVTNSLYLRIQPMGAGNYSSYSGLQIK